MYIKIYCLIISENVLFCFWGITPGRRQSKTPILLRSVDQKSLETEDQKSLETEFLIAIFRHTGDKWQSKKLFLSIFDPSSSIVDIVFDCRLPDVGIDCSTRRDGNTVAQLVVCLFPDQEGPTVSVLFCP